MTTQELRKQVMNIMNKELGKKVMKSRIMKIAGQSVLIFYVDKNLLLDKQNIMIMVYIEHEQQEDNIYKTLAYFTNTKEAVEEVLNQYQKTPVSERKRKVTRTKTVH